MSTLLEHFEANYDLVIIDSPPVSVVSDTIPLLTAVSGVLVVARVGKTSRDTAKQLAVGMVGLGDHGIDLLAQVAAGFAAVAARMQAHLLAEGGDAQARQAAGHAHGIQRTQHFQRAVLVLVGHGHARQRTVGEHGALDDGAALQHVQADALVVDGHRQVSRLVGAEGLQRSQVGGLLDDHRVAGIEQQLPHQVQPLLRSRRDQQPALARPLCGCARHHRPPCHAR